MPEPDQTAPEQNANGTNPPTRLPKSVVFLPPGRWPTTIEPLDPETASDTAGVQRRMTQLGITVTTINPYGKPWNPLGNSNPYYQGLDFLRAIKVLLTHRRASVIVVVFESGGVFLLLLRRLFFFRPKIILWDASIGNPWRVVQTVQKIVLKRFDGLMMLTTRQVELLHSRHHVPGKVFHLGYNVDEEFFHPRYSRSGEYVLSVGDDRSRDYNTVLEAVRPLNVAVKLKTRWRPDGGADARPPHVEFLSSRLSDQDFRSLYGGAKFVVLALHDVESAGGITVLFEAMAMGKAVIISESGVAADFAVDGVTALIVPRHDVHALNAAIRKLLDDPQLCDTLGRNARQVIETRFSTNHLVERMNAFIADVTQ